MSFGDVPDLVGLPGIHIEVKRAEQVRLSEWMAQAIAGQQAFPRWYTRRIPPQKP